MALIKIALLLFISVEACGQTSAFSDAPDAQTANGDVCKDCTQIIELFLDLMNNPDFQKKLTADLDHVCDLLPGATSKICKGEVEKMLPTVISFIAAFAKPAEVCKIIGLCGSRDKQVEMLQYFANEAGVTTENVQSTTLCSFCIFLVKTLEDLLPKERTEDALIGLLNEICHILPSSHRDQCKAVISKFTKMVLDAILGFATPQAICTLIHECKGQEASPPLDPCALSMYRCRDVRTAAKCGTLFYCQKFAWKPVNYSTL